MTDFSESDMLHTQCTHCGCTFEITNQQLDQAGGKVRCSECNEVFNAYNTIEVIHSVQQNIINDEEPHDIEETVEAVTLHEAMNEGIDGGSIKTTKSISFIWLLAIVIFAILALTQWLYLDRFNLIKDTRFQPFILSICNIVGCQKDALKNRQQIRLIERNIFTHPTEKNALLINGSFVNEAPFAQILPLLKVSLFDLQGKIIAQRIFKPTEYLSKNHHANSFASGETIYFKIEVADPNNIAITYEFEFL